MPSGSAMAENNLPLSSSEIISGDRAEHDIAAVARGIARGDLIPYLGPGVLSAAGDGVPVPVTPEAIAIELNRLVPVPGRIRSNMWAVAQYIEQQRHRKTLVSCMTRIFSLPVAPTPLHAALAALDIPLIVDTWYDGAMRAALSCRTDWSELQGVTRALESTDIWFRAYAPSGKPCRIETAGAARTVLYKPHGAVTPAQNFLVADSDYVEVLAEIDIQNPIPSLVKQARTGRGFVFLGCRFHDQMLRSYARQIVKRSRGRHFAFVNAVELTKNELKFLAEIGATLIDAGESRLVKYLET
jgi:hypothetical protein